MFLNCKMDFIKRIYFIAICPCTELISDLAQRIHQLLREREAGVWNVCGIARVVSYGVRRLRFFFVIGKTWTIINIAALRSL